MIAYYPETHIIQQRAEVEIFKTDYTSAKAITDSDKSKMMIHDATDGGYWVMPKYDGVFTVVSKGEE